MTETLIIEKVYEIPFYGDALVRGLQDEGQEKEYSERITKEFLKFVTLIKLHPDETFGMAGAVDNVWHNAILHTKKYAEFCNIYIGNFLHHTPIQNKSGSFDDYENTIKRLTQHYGDVDRSIWPTTPEAIITCGGNGCGGDLEISCQGDGSPEVSPC